MGSGVRTVGLWTQLGLEANIMPRSPLTLLCCVRAFFTLNHYGAVVDNPDQRICDDIASFVNGSVILVMGLVRKVMSCLAFAG